MELALSLGDSRKPFDLLDKAPKVITNKLGFCMGVKDDAFRKGEEKDRGAQNKDGDDKRGGLADSDPPLRLDLLPFSPVQHKESSSQLLFPWLINRSSPSGVRVNRVPPPVARDEVEDATTSFSSPNSTLSSFPMEFGIGNCGGRNNRESDQVETERTSSRTSDDDADPNGLTRKKLRLSKEQSAFLEESFKEHSTLNPKQKLALARQLNLRPRQVEVWFQNRRARTKLKQTEVDCEYLKKCCETLTEENKRLQKELQELRALKTSQPFHMQLPATTLTMCPSCERVSATTTTSPSATAAANTSAALPLGSSRLFPLPNAALHRTQPQQPAS